MSPGRGWCRNTEQRLPGLGGPSANAAAVLSAGPEFQNNTLSCHLHNINYNGWPLSPQDWGAEDGVNRENKAPMPVTGLRGRREVKSERLNESIPALSLGG